VSPTSSTLESVRLEEPTAEELLALTGGDRLAIACALAEAAKRGLLPDGTRMARIVGPKTNLELLEAVEQLTGYRLPRASVCTEHGHRAPADTFCDLYFERIRNCLWIGNRGGGKTTASGFLNAAKCRYNPDYKAAIAGAVEKQGYRAYAEFKRFTRKLDDEINDTLLSKTNWGNGAFFEVLGGTVKALNGPHPHFAQFDEAELTTTEPFEEFLNMAQGDEKYSAQQLLTSTRKKAHGMVQRIVKQVNEALRLGQEPPWRIEIFCVFETLARVPNCRSAPENADRPESELCDCHKVAKGTWEDGRERTFEEVCGGRAFRSDGFVALADAQSRFRQLSRGTWESQQECLSPSVEGLVHKWINESVVLPDWEPHAMFGPIYRGWDWGGQNPHAVVWCQYLNVDVGLVEDEEGRLVPLLSDEDHREIVRTIPAKTLIQFDEIYGNADVLGEFSSLGLRVVLKQEQWRSYGYALDVERDFCDPAGLVAKREVRKAVAQLIEAIETDTLTGEQVLLLEHYGVSVEDQDHAIEVPTFKSSPAPRYESIRKHIEWGEDGRILLVEPRCPHTSDEYDVYRWEEAKAGKNAPEDAAKEDDHAMDAKRYLIWNLIMLEHRARNGSERPAAEEREAPATASGGPFAPVRVAPSKTAIPTVELEAGLPVHLSTPPAAAVAGSVRSGAYRSARR
jgi:hypothetical protein